MHLPLCNHEEADTGLLLHAEGAVKKSCRKIGIQMADRNVVEVALSKVQGTDAIELWAS